MAHEAKALEVRLQEDGFCVNMGPGDSGISAKGACSRPCCLRTSPWSLIFIARSCFLMRSSNSTPTRVLAAETLLALYVSACSRDIDLAAILAVASVPFLEHCFRDPLCAATLLKPMFVPYYVPKYVMTTRKRSDTQDRKHLAPEDNVMAYMQCAVFGVIRNMLPSHANSEFCENTIQLVDSSMHRLVQVIRSQHKNLMVELEKASPHCLHTTGVGMSWQEKGQIQGAERVRLKQGLSSVRLSVHPPTFNTVEFTEVACVKEKYNPMYRETVHREKLTDASRYQLTLSHAALPMCPVILAMTIRQTVIIIMGLLGSQLACVLYSQKAAQYGNLLKMRPPCFGRPGRRDLNY
ncbi:hypothetical protein CRENBAI_016617 [Crenichthys baileyi]|uniref:Uncharacterized protein n=1 Tax=Crenichthys baileyi TaxID=28760 RepID=A0AAV9S5I0_9TELE